VTIEDVRRRGHCVAGARRWFAEKGLDFRDFLKNGLEEDTVAAIGDGYSDQILAAKRERDRAGG
jgi:hypothetical protein